MVASCRAGGEPAAPLAVSCVQDQAAGNTVVAGSGVVVGVTVLVAVGVNIAVGVMALVAVGVSVDVAVGVMVLVVAVGVMVLVAVAGSVAVHVAVAVVAGFAMGGAGTGCALRPLAWLGAGQSMLLAARAINRVSVADTRHDRRNTVAAIIAQYPQVAGVWA
jgi:hypothetical protein